jgi:hypothetical protein
MVAVLVLLPIEAARACSCVGYGDMRDRLAEADGAIVGTFLESHDADADPTGSSGQDWIYTFQVDEEVKGTFDDMLEVHSPMNGISCGLEVQVGQQYGLFLYVREDGAWTSSLCAQTSPEEMRKAATPLPEPTSTRPVRFIVGGSFGKAQVVGLDGRGEIVAYGFGDRDVTQVDACPGGRRIVEVGQSLDAPPRLFVRRVRDFKILRQRDLPFGPEQRFPDQRVTDVLCRTKDAGRIVVFSTDYGEPTAKGRLTEFTPGASRLIRKGSGRFSTFDGGRAYLASGRWGRDLISVGLDRGGMQALGTVPGYWGGNMSVSPDGETLAGLSHPRYVTEDSKPHKIYTLALNEDGATPRVRDLSTNPDDYGDVEWAGNRQIVYVSFGSTSHTFSRGLKRKGSLRLWGRDPVVANGRVYCVEYGKVRTAVLPDGPARRFRLMPSQVTYTLDAIN